MQKLSDQQKADLIDQGHGWQSDQDQEIPVIFPDADNRYSCLCSDDLIDYHEFWRMEHQSGCVLSGHFNVIYSRFQG